MHVQITVRSVPHRHRRGAPAAGRILPKDLNDVFFFGRDSRVQWCNFTSPIREVNISTVRYQDLYSFDAPAIGCVKKRRLTTFGPQPASRKLRTASTSFRNEGTPF